MDGLISLLIFAIFFYVMMRFGCGAHMVHGHGKNGKHNKANKDNDIDPVCDMTVETTQGYGKMHKNQLYRFCSRDCLDKFELEPEKYIHTNHNLKHNSNSTHRGSSS